MKLFRKRSQKKSQQPLSEVYYDSVKVMPIVNWFNLHEDTTYSQLVKKGKEDDGRLLEAYTSLIDSYLESFGIDRHYEELLIKKCELELLEINFALTKDRSNITFINIAKRELEELTSAKFKDSRFDTVVMVEKEMGFKLNLNDVTVFEYYNYINNIKKWRKAG